MSKLFEGYRGSPPGDTEAIKDLLLRVSAMIEDIPEIAEMDLNPVNVMPRGEGYGLSMPESNSSKDKPRRTPDGRRPAMSTTQ